MSMSGCSYLFVCVIGMETHLCLCLGALVCSIDMNTPMSISRCSYLFVCVIATPMSISRYSYLFVCVIATPMPMSGCSYIFVCVIAKPMSMSGCSYLFVCVIATPMSMSGCSYQSSIRLRKVPSFTEIKVTHLQSESLTYNNHHSLAKCIYFRKCLLH